MPVGAWQGAECTALAFPASAPQNAPPTPVPEWVRLPELSADCRRIVLPLPLLALAECPSLTCPEGG